MVAEDLVDHPKKLYPVSWLVGGGYRPQLLLAGGDGFFVLAEGDFVDCGKDRRLEAGAGKASPQEVLEFFVGQAEVEGVDVGHGIGWGE